MYIKRIYRVMNQQLSEEIKVLLSWRDKIAQEQEELRKCYQETAEEISKKDSQLRNIISLLESAGYIEKSRYPSELAENASLADCAFHVLSKYGKPIYYKDLTDRLLQDSILIPGKNAAANLLSHIVRDSRFKRIKRGTYVLSEWKYHTKVMKHKKRQYAKKNRRKK